MVKYGTGEGIGAVAVIAGIATLDMTAGLP